MRITFSRSALGWIALASAILSLVVLLAPKSLQASNGNLQDDYQGGTSFPSQAPLASLSASSLPQGTVIISQNVELVSQMGGPINMVAVRGDTAYVGTGPSLVILNVSDPAHPIVVGQTRPLPDIVTGESVSGTYAYVADGNSGMYIFDISDPAHPAQIGSWSAPYGTAAAVSVAGSYAYVAYDYGSYSQGTLRVVNIFDPAQPIEVGVVATSGPARDVVVSDDYAYVAEGRIWDGKISYGGGLRVISVLTPTAPAPAGFYDSPGQPTGVAVAGGYAYLSDGTDGLRIVNISSPTAPYEVGFHVTPGYALDVAVAGNDAYIADGATGLRIINIYNRAAPYEAGFYDTPGRALAVAAASGYVYIADDSSLIVTDPAHASAPVGSYSAAAGFAKAVAVAGPYAYLADGDSGLRVINLSDPSHPAEIGFYDTPGYASSIAVEGNLAYVADGYQGLQIVNISDPANPYRIGSFTQWPGSGVVVTGPLAYVSSGYSGLRIINIANPADPYQVGLLDTTGEVAGVAVVGPLAYVADGVYLRIVNVSDPSNPQEVSAFHITGYAANVTVQDHYAYVSSYGNLRILDVSNPMEPVEVGVFTTTGTMGNVVVQEHLAYLADAYRGLRVVKVSDPTHLVEVGFYDTLSATGVAISGDYAYVADGSGGLVILRPRAKAVTAAFTATPLFGRPPLTVTFTNQSVGNYTSSLWDFGDGFTSTLTHPTHTYTALGAYTVKLMVNGPEDSDTLIKPALVAVLEPAAYLPIITYNYAPVQPDFDAAPTAGQVPLTVIFTNTSSGIYVSSLWDFGDGVTGTLQSPTHTFTMPGIYTVSLTVSGPGGSDILMRSNYITAYPSTALRFVAPAAQTAAQLPRQRRAWR
jgi:hypothetical protein